MSLTDIMSSSNLAVYPQIALIIFLCVFVTGAARTILSRRCRDAWERAATLPLDECRIARPVEQETP